MIDQIINRLIKLKFLHLLWVTVLASEIFSGIIVSLMSIAFHGRVTNDYLITSVVTALLTSLIVVSILLYLFAERDKMAATIEAAANDLRLFRKLIDGSTDAIFVADAETALIVDVNDRACASTGYSREELLSMHVMDVDAGAMELSGWREQVKVFREKGSLTIEVSHKRKNGTTFPVEINVSYYPLDDRRGYVFGIARDITERKRIEQEYLNLRKFESIGILAGGIAHDFNNLLTGILGNITIAKTLMKPDDKAFARLTESVKFCLLARDLSNRLATYSSGGDPKKEIMSLSGLLVDVVRSSLQGSPIHPEFDLPDNLYPVSVDEKHMRQVIQNLALNAKEAMPLGGKFIISGKNILVDNHDIALLQPGKYLLISFRDAGIGIPSEDLEKIFDPYYSSKDTYNVKGLGLGLAVCFSVIKKHKGMITAESEEGKGTCFHMYLPAAS